MYTKQKSGLLLNLFLDLISNMTILATLLCLFFIFLAMLHLYWALGGQWALWETIPHINGKPAFHPNAPMMIGLTVALIGIASLFILLACPIEALLPWTRYIAWGLAGVFFARAVGDFKALGFSKKIKDSDFAYWDTRLYSPLCVLVGIGFIILSV